ncbi:tRNA lysidine(34) synthetase TilS [Natranaerobius thermophilus]|uniref:tRNA(Ile)-lysidine synthase n=1 Tax=Natranaerobius thermophilus (strain ATCC BAA-1301 / DSM 18059 / JW/NM-WN-LF) TaxID=457570 RepID=B2A3Q2_NATTJ|nr:tRNA lysidine(34) synthetase TilS [Natranaerobius thermophilus]ACB83678.1 tRNA(Ile)-lysidine synthetase [Natranaerobius thermophilus JW/NM-WN-LF]
MKEKVYQNIFEKGLIKSGDKVLVGVSGGPDSVALLHVLYELRQELQFKLVVSHLNHGFRDKSAEEDADFVKKLAEDLELPIIYDKWQVKDYINYYKLSPQQGARIQRYKFFEQAAKDFGATKLALGHHIDDQVETFFLRLIRGAGTQGLSGMQFIRKLNNDLLLIRPLLEVSKSEIKEYLQTNKLKYKIDPTNQETNYLRNKVRHEILPVFQDINPNINERLLETMELLKEENDYLNKAANELYQKSQVDTGRSQNNTKPLAYQGQERELLFCLKTLQKSPKVLLRRILLTAVYSFISKTDQEDRHLNSENVSKKHIDAVAKMIELGLTGKEITLPGKIYTFIDTRMISGQSKQVMVISDQNLTSSYAIQGTKQAELEVPGWTYWPLSNMWLYSYIKDHKSEQSSHYHKTINRNSFEATLDYDKIDLPVIIRNRKVGDRFVPLGMNSPKKLKDFFIDEKVPRNYRDKIPLLVSGRGEILWVIGYRINEQYKVTKDTRRYFCIEAQLSEY